MAHSGLFAEVIMPLAVPKTYTYAVPEDLADALQVGQRVIAQFGRGGKMYSGVVDKIHSNAPKGYHAKFIDALVDYEPIVTSQQLDLWRWMADYYMCGLGEIMIASLPGVLRLTSETRILANPEFNESEFDITPEEQLLLDVLESRTVLSLHDIAVLFDKKNIQPLVRGLIEQGAVVVEEEIKEAYKPKKRTFIRLAEAYEKEDKLHEVFDQLEKRAPKQLELLMKYMQMSDWYGSRQEVDKVVLQNEVGATASTVNSMVKKGIVEVYEKKVGRIGGYDGEEKEISSLSKEQKGGLKEIQQYFDDEKVVLLHGVTASGKTEIYVQLIEKAIKEDKQVLYLVPEIALTTQLIERLRKYFGDQVGVYHSRYNQNERVEIWKELLKGEKSRFKVVLGARSAVLLPFSNLGLIIVDEEHENSFKQYDPAPRYNARDSAILLAQLHKGNCLLGSATPSIESFENARAGKFGYVELRKRYGGVQLPEIQIADIKQERRKKTMTEHFSSLLLTEMEEALRNGEQIILFQNRRGYAPYLICTTCGTVPQCIRCDISVTYHKLFKHMNCHYCGYTEPVPNTCAACGSSTLEFKGFGTEQIEESLMTHFPGRVVARMDLDTTRSRSSYGHILEQFELGMIDILVGTQMVTKGLDFDNVGLVGVLNADSLLNYPDFRAFERAYQLMAQVSGRAGRKAKRGKVIIQTMNPEHPVILDVMDNKYEHMVEEELKERKDFNYPPYSRLVALTFRHSDIKKVTQGAKEYTNAIRKKLGGLVLGPEFPLIPRVRNQYIQRTLLKVGKEYSFSKVKKVLNDELRKFSASSANRAIRIQIDVDPQ